MIKGKSLEEALTLTNRGVADALDGLPPAKMHCSVLAEEAVKAAIADYCKKNGKEVPLSARLPECCCHACDPHDAN